MQNRPQTIRIFLPDGSPSTIKEAEIESGLMCAIYFNRNALEKVGKRGMVKNAGIYFLFGEDTNGNIAVYIGEAINCWKRIKNHNRKKDFWTHGIIVTTKTNQFAKTELGFLEQHSLKIARAIKRYKPLNKNKPKHIAPSESKLHSLLDNFEGMKILLATLGYPIFDELKRQGKEYYYCKGKDADATCLLTDEGYLVLEDSIANLEETDSAGNWVTGLRRRLKEEEVLVKNDNVLKFTTDKLFNSPSAAAAAVLGRRANGWTEWKDKDGKTLDELKRQS